MLEKLKQSWRHFQLKEPGQRFQAGYRERQKSGHGVLRRLLFIGAGLILLAVGIFFLPAPGPGLVIVFIGASLLAQESLWLARVLDAADLAVRNAYAWGKRWAHGISPGLKMLLVFGALLLFAAFGFGIYQLVSGHWL